MSYCTPALLAFAAASTFAHASVLSYNPALATLPESQGWSFRGTSLASASAASGTLTYGSTTVAGTTFWGHNPTDQIDFTTDTVFIQADLRLTGAMFGNYSGFRRGGFSLYLEDDFGRWIIADLGDNAISLGNDNNRLSDPVSTFDLTDTFHLVRLEAGPAGARLFVDGVQQLTLSLGSGGSSGAQGSFGEMTILAATTLTEVRSAQYIPTPGPALVACAACLFAPRRTRR